MDLDGDIRELRAVGLARVEAVERVGLALGLVAADVGYIVGVVDGVGLIVVFRILAGDAEQPRDDEVVGVVLLLLVLLLLHHHLVLLFLLL